MRPVRVALSVEAIEPQLTGIGRYTLELARGLPRAAGICDVRYFRGPEIIENPNSLLADTHGERSSSRLQRWWAKRRETATFRDIKSSIVHGPNFFLPDWAETGIATVHDLSVLRFPETHPQERREEFEVRFSNTLKRADRIITGANAMRDELAATLGIPDGKIDVIPHGIRRSVRPADDALIGMLSSFGLTIGGYCLCVSTIEPRKRIGQLIEAYEQLPAALRTLFPLVLVGKHGWLADDILAKIDRAVRSGWLKWIGFAPDAVRDALYFGARLFVYPSLYEGYGLPPLEAMAHDVPVLISTDPCLTEVSGPAAMIVDVEDREAFAADIVRGLQDEDWRQFAVERGRALVDRLDWRRTIELTVASYRKVQ